MTTETKFDLVDAFVPLSDEGSDESDSGGDSDDDLESGSSTTPDSGNDGYGSDDEEGSELA